MTGDTIHLLNNVKTDQLDSLWVFEHAFIIQEDSIKGFNQVKGKRMYGLFENNELYELNLIQNTETIYYTRNNEGQLIGINKTLSSSIKMLLEDREIQDIYYYNTVDGIVHPEGELPENAQKLKGFNWRGDERLDSKADLFANEPPLDLPKIQGIPLPKTPEAFFDERDENDALLLNEKSRLTPEILQEHERDSVQKKEQKKMIRDTVFDSTQFQPIPKPKNRVLKSNLLQDSLPQKKNPVLEMENPSSSQRPPKI